MAIALFGGAFNPIHNDHLGMAQYLLKNGYDKVVLAPSNNPPHKVCELDYDTRVEMMKRAIEGDERLVICQLEKTLSNINYSYQTIPLYQTIFGKFDFVIGGDSLIDLHKWKNPEEVIKLTNIIVFNRGNREQEFNEALEYWTQKGANIKVLDYETHNISSSRVRLEARLGLVRNVHPSVAEYIQTNKVYYEQELLKGASLSKEIAIPLSEELSEFRYEHVLRTALYALYLNNKCKLGLNPTKILLAGVLHDCAKEDKTFTDPAVPEDSIGTPVWHQFAGARKAQIKYKVTDIEVISAIMHHCTARPNMAQLDKLIWTADMLEPKSLFKDMDKKERLINLVEEDFDKGFVEALKESYKHIKAQKRSVYPLTEEAVKFYTKEN